LKGTGRMILGLSKDAERGLAHMRSKNNAKEGWDDEGISGTSEAATATRSPRKTRPSLLTTATRDRCDLAQTRESTVLAYQPVFLE
jgi:hypothetical protein